MDEIQQDKPVRRSRRATGSDSSETKVASEAPEQASKTVKADKPEASADAEPKKAPARRRSTASKSTSETCIDCLV